MAKGWIDADFEVVGGAFRQGDPHPDKPRWRYAGVDRHGRAVWRRPPRFNRLQLFGLACAGALLFRLVVALVVSGLHRLAPHWPG